MTTDVVSGLDTLASRLVSAGVLGEEDLKSAQRLQGRLGGTLASAVIRGGYASEEVLLPVLSEFTGVPLHADSDVVVNGQSIESACNRLGAPLAWFLARECIPFVTADDELTVAAREPFLAELRDFVGQTAAGRNAKWRFCTKSSLEILAAAARGPDVDALQPSSAHLRELAEEAPVVEYVNGLIAKSVDERASDLHVEPGEGGFAVRLRVDGVMHELHRMPRQQFDAVVSRIKLISGLDIAERRLPQDGRFSTRASGVELDLRVSVIPTVHGESIVLRFLPKNLARLTLDSTGMQADDLQRLRNWLEMPNGIVLVTGPTGSGKSTTLYAALEAAQDGLRKIITVEDPVEYQLPDVTQIQVQAEIGFTFAQALRVVLRHDPDVILVGEIRDAETASIAVQAALTGHLVLASLHTNDAAGAIPRLIDMGVEPFLISATLRGVIAQRLVRKLCPRCSTPDDEGRWADIAKSLGSKPDFRRPVGCAACGGSGYRGRTGIYEFIQVDERSRDLIRVGTEGATSRFESLRTRTMLQDGVQKAAAGVTSMDEVLKAVSASESESA
jgi:general secretion pathway protein E